MFHVLLALPALATLGVWAAFLLCAPLWLGFFLQVVLTVAGRPRWLVWIPAALGAVGMAWSLFTFRPDLMAGWILAYWAVFYLILWLTWLVTDRVKKFVIRFCGKE